MRFLWAAVSALPLALLVGLLAKNAEHPIVPVKLGEGGYDIEELVAPQATGGLLRLLSGILSSEWLGPIICRILLHDNGMHTIRQLAEQVSGPIVQWPLVRLGKGKYETHVKLAKEAHGALVQTGPPAGGSAKAGQTFVGVLSYQQRYREKESTPVDEVRRILAAAKSLSHLNMFVELFEASAMEEAARSAKRWAEGKPIGPLDGIPWALKDEIAIQGTVLGAGAVWPGRNPEAADDLIVSRLRAAGALLIGKTVMVEFGILPLGWNAHFQGPLNPYNKSHYTGGSSSGSAVAVATGLVPFAVGFDGGGSVRIPSALCGLYGISPTFTRIPFDAPMAQVMSNVHAGVLAADAASLGLAYQLLAVPEPNHFYTDMYAGSGPPPPHLFDFNNVNSLSGLRLGIFTPHFEDAEPIMVAQCKSAVDALKRIGATVVEVRIPHLQVLSKGHALSISAEMSSLHDLDWHTHREYLNADSSINLALFRTFTAKELISTYRLRGWGMRWLRDQVFSDVDIYVSPATGRTAPILTEDAKRYGESDTAMVMQIMKYIFMGNFLGNPGVVVPVGYDTNSLPIGLHLMADHWEEAKLFRTANALQAHHISRQAPGTFVQA